MAEVMNFIYGGVIIAAVVTAWMDILPLIYLPFVILGMGVLVMLTPTGQGGYQRKGFWWFRKYFFGGYMILVGIMSWVDAYTTFPYLTNTSVYSLFGQIILLAIGVIYFFAAFERTRNIQISTA